ncbi:TRAP transporter substrate-binding protein [Mesobacillus harenae]|uniref:TRAP transporter substrate-binding protein n=1 Tax=Mesobacillus harenae TaxID=2213203 RepID=UPI00157FF921|nr:TRAP transporter substrate-binding protein [Mesobacillus harenae]
MKKSSFLISTVLLLGIIVSACSSSTSGENNSDGAGDKQVTLKFATTFAGGDGQIGQTMSKFKELVESGTDGSVEVEIFDSGSLGGERDILESVSAGSVDVSLSGLSDVVYWLPDHFLSAPYLFRDQEHVNAVYTGEIGKEIDEKILEQKGIRTLSIMDRGPRHVTSNKKVETPEDLEGLKLRLPENPLWVDTWGSLGVNPTVVAFNELYSALQTGIVDAQENPLETIVQSQFYEVQDYLILTGHVRDIYKIQISEESWNKLNEEQQEVVLTAAAEATELGNQVLTDSEDEYLKLLEDEGMEIIEIDLELFTEALSGSGQKIANEHMKAGLYESVKADY